MKCLQYIGDKPMIQIQRERLLKVDTFSSVWVATTPDSKDIQYWCNCFDENFCFVGSDYDVLDRITKFSYARDMKENDVLVKFTHDSPLIDPEIVNRIVSQFLSQGGDFGFLRGFPKGMYFNMMRVGALRDLSNKISTEDRAIWNKLNETWVWYKYGFKLRGYDCQFDFSDLNLEVNTVGDLELIRSIFSGTGDV